MATIFERPGPQVRQVSGRDPDGNTILSVIAKRTYHIGTDGTCAPAEEQVALVEEPADDADVPGSLGHDSDLHAWKPRTDIVVRGHAWGGGRTWFEASIRIEDYEYRLLVVGDRSCHMDHAGRIHFSEPERIEKVPLRFDHAYGGWDAQAEAKYGNPYAAPFAETPGAAPFDVDSISPWRYARNPCGRGFLVEATREALESVVLPNLEDPWDRVSPERIAAREPGEWIRMPMPRVPSWIDYGWFPRCAWFGIVPPFAPLESEVAETTRGFISPQLLDMKTPDAPQIFRGMCGAAPDLQLPHLRGDERILLQGLHAARNLMPIRLPADVPAIWTDGRQGTYRETTPVLHTVLIEPDHDRLSLVWRGAAPALRPYLDEELNTMPLYVTWPT